MRFRILCTGNSARQILMDSVPNTKCADLVDRFAEAVATSKSIGIIGLRDAPAQVSAPVAGQSPVSRRLHHRRP